MPSESRLSLWFEAPRHVHVRESAIPAPGHGTVLIQSICSAISAGSELLAYQGLLPKGVQLDTSISGMVDVVDYPLQYGYSLVGLVVEIGKGVDASLLGKRVFLFHSHESHFLASPKELVVLPDGISEEDAALLANMETAVNLALDGAPLIGERVLVMGMGMVGQLLSMVLQEYPLGDLLAIDPIKKRRSAFRYKKARTGEPSCLEKEESFDLVYETSGVPEALNSAIKITGYHGRIVVGSWYGRKPATLELGAHFHRSKITMYSSQVSHIDPSLAGRWDKERRLDVAFEMLKKVKPRRLITHEFSIEHATNAYKMLSENKESLQAIITY